MTGRMLIAFTGMRGQVLIAFAGVTGRVFGFLQKDGLTAWLIAGLV
jgi:hypothetical protein